MGIQWWYLVKYVTCGCIWNGAHRQTGYQYFSKENYRWNWGYAISRQTHIYGLYSGYWPLLMPGPASPSSSLPSQSLTKVREITLRTNSIYSTSIYLFRNEIWDNLWNQQRNIYKYDWLRSLFRYCIIYIYVYIETTIFYVYTTDIRIVFPNLIHIKYIYICNMYIYI